MKGTLLAVSTLVALAGLPTAADGAIIAYWNQNDNQLPSGAFGFNPDSFPQPADFGNGTLELANFDQTTAGDDESFTTIQSFAGTTDNAQFGDEAGGSLSPQGGPGEGTDRTNNGMQILLNVDTTGFHSINVSWAQRGTATGFTSREFRYSVDGGVFFSDPVPFDGDSGALGATWTVPFIDLSDVPLLNNNPDVVFMLTLDGATGATGNNRFDNILIQGIPEPASVVLMLLAGVALVGVGRRRAR